MKGNVSVITSISMSLPDINEMISGMLLRTDGEFIRADIKGGEIRSTLAITDECFLGCEDFDVGCLNIVIKRYLR